MVYTSEDVWILVQVWRLVPAGEWLAATIDYSNFVAISPAFSIGKSNSLKPLIAARNSAPKSYNVYLATKYEGDVAKHSMVGIDNLEGNGILWFDQVMDVPYHKELFGGKYKVADGKIRFVTNGPGEQYKITALEVTQEQARKAVEKAKSMVGPNTYNSLTQSCVTCARKVINGAGQRIPPTKITPSQLDRAVNKKRNSSVIQEPKH